MRVRPWQGGADLEFLRRRFAVSMFLLGNLEDRGPLLSEHPNSGNFKVLERDGAVVGVFSLTRRGNLLLNVEASAEAYALVLAACRAEAIELKGVLGEWECTSGMWKLLHAEGVFSSSTFESQEVLYQLEEIPSFPAEPSVRFLVAEDFPEWRPIRRAYTAEEGLTHDLPDEDLRANFLRYSAMQEYWGYFESGRLISTAALNARAMGVGQVGGVYTVPERRGQGLSKRVMRQMLRDCKEVHGLERMILFTGEQNVAAQRVYEGLGFERIGYFGIFFS